MEIKGLLFDKDGTLLEFHQMWLQVAKGAAADTLNAYPTESSCDNHQTNVDMTTLLAAIGVYGDYVDNHGLLASNPVEDTAEAWYQLLQLSSDKNIFCQTVKKLFNKQVEDNPALIQALPEVKDKLMELKAQGFKLGIATADSKDATLYSLMQTQLHDLFDFVGYSDGDIAPKPAPALLNAFCQVCDLAPQQVIMFGDTVSDMKFGRNAGASTIGVLTGTASEDELQPYADIVLYSVADFNTDLLMTINQR
ncbi:HAD family hydrolase [Moritella sp. F3]|uniref:HAD family hydrolase n=1 Tax=Moritella sp. F3 TaxID=2718882 RepID=UPI0018E0F9AF|nr:HAD family hydrolase [Moritella sp. F3]GIC76271.1 haloacid dehalogenase [Moritella sp. F1]GIC82941.1 haloacid dehalogenase [Moritella sp. F3]